MKKKYEKESFEKLVKSSLTIKEICKKLGLRKSGGGSSTVSKYIKIYNIDTSHFKNRPTKENFFRISLEEALTENSNYKSTNHLKDRLYKEGVKKRECELCGQGEEWKGKHMSLILDHINGINNDNRLENLRIVCPNCNATLETHCRGNKKREYSIDLNEKINSKSKWYYQFRKPKERKKCENCQTELKSKNKHNLCKKCYDIKQRKVERPSIEDLIADVEKNGYEATGRKYKVTGNCIKKWIKNKDKWC